MVKMVFSDLDGTFLTPDKIITAENRNMLDVAYARGVQFVPCTGRNLSDIPSERWLIQVFRMRFVAMALSW